MFFGRKGGIQSLGADGRHLIFVSWIGRILILNTHGAEVSSQLLLADGGGGYIPLLTSELIGGARSARRRSQRGDSNAILFFLSKVKY